VTGQGLLDRMELLNQELQLQSGEADVTRGLLALNVAQDYFESLAALRPQILGSSTGTVATVNATETTSFPTGLLRIDRLQLLDSSDRVVRDVYPLQRVGGHRMSQFWPLNITSSSTSGAPRYYKAFASALYWTPLPDAAYNVRWYGFARASDITAAGIFAYDDGVALPLASFAAQLMKTGVGDEVSDLQGLAMGTFSTILDTLSQTNRDQAPGLAYTQVHTE
jgi:hypothetical protein